MQRGFNISWFVVPVTTLLGIAIVRLPVSDSLQSAWVNGLGWGLLLTIPLCGLSAAFRIPVLIRRQQLRRVMPNAIVESSTRTGALSNDLARLNELDGGVRDSTWGALCFVFDETGLSAWRWNDPESPDWTFPWSALSEPVVGPVRSKALASSWVYRGLTVSISVDGQRSDVHLVLLGAGFLGIFALSTSRLNEIAGACASWRNAKNAEQHTP